jgi:hypothetical protein
MPSGQPTGFTPDDVYCVYCHAPAAGTCASCQALICGDCAELTGGAVQKAAVCASCFEAGRGRVRWDGGLWWWVLGAVVVALIVFSGR